MKNYKIVRLLIMPLSEVSGPDKKSQIMTLAACYNMHYYANELIHTLVYLSECFLCVFSL